MRATLLLLLLGTLLLAPGYESCDLFILNARTRDVNGNGKLDAIDLEFDVNVLDTSITVNSFTVSNYVVSGISTGSGVNDQIFRVLLTERILTWDTDVTPVITYVNNSGLVISGGAGACPLATLSKQAIDGAPPAIAYFGWPADTNIGVAFKGLYIQMSEPLNVSAIAPGAATSVLTFVSGNGATGFQAILDTWVDNDGTDGRLAVTATSPNANIGDNGIDTICFKVGPFGDFSGNAVLSCGTGTATLRFLAGGLGIYWGGIVDSDHDGHIDRLRLRFHADAPPALSAVIYRADWFPKSLNDSTYNSSALIVPGYTVLPTGDTGVTANDFEYFAMLQPLSSYDTGASPLMSVFKPIIMDWPQVTTDTTRRYGYGRGRLLPTLEDQGTIPVFTLEDVAQPVMVKATGMPGSDIINVTFSEGVTSTAGSGGALLSLSNFNYVDGGSGTRTIQSIVAHNSPSSGSYIMRLSAALDFRAFCQGTGSKITPVMPIYDWFVGGSDQVTQGNAVWVTTLSLTNPAATPPTLLSASTEDSDGNGHIDRILLVFSFTMLDSSFGSGAGWSVVGHSVSNVITGSGVNDDRVYLVINELAAGDTGSRPNITYSGTSVTDTGCNQLARITTARTPIDAARPVLLSATSTVDNNVVLLNFSEPVFTALTPSSVVLSSAASMTGAAIVAVLDGDANDTIARVIINKYLSYADFFPVGTRDTLTVAPNTLFDAASLAADSARVVPLTNSDVSPPSITAIGTRDSDLNGKIDRIRVAFSENITDTTVVAGNFQLGLGYVISGFVTGTTVNDNVIFLVVNEMSSYDGGVTPSLSYSGTGLTDRNNNALPTSSNQASTDGVAPRLVEATTTVGSTQLNLTFNERIQAISLANVFYTNGNPGGAASISGLFQAFTGESYAIVSVNSAFVLGDFFRAGISVVYDYVNTSTALLDAVGNAALQVNVPITNSDKVKPVIVTAYTQDVNLDGFLDRIELTFSKALDLTTIQQSTFSVGTYTITGLTTTGSTVINLQLQPKIDPDTGIVPAVTYRQGYLQDTNGNLLDNNTAPVQDRARPILMSATGVVGNRTITFTFSEPILTAVTVPSATVSADGSIVFPSLTVLDSDATDRVAVFNAQTPLILSYFRNVNFSFSGLADSPPASNTILTRVVPLTNSNTVPPAFYAVYTRDFNGNGKLDTLQILFSQWVDDTTLTGATFRFGSCSPTCTYNLFNVNTGDFINDNVVHVNITEIAGAQLFDTGFIGPLSYISGSLTNRDALPLAPGAFISSTDGASPIMYKAAGLDGSTQITVFFSEGVSRSPWQTNLAANDFGYIDNTAGSSTGITGIADADGSDGSVVLQLNAAPTPGMDIDSDEIELQGVIQDQTGNVALHPRRVVLSSADLTPPKITDAKTSDGAGTGRINQIIVTFDKPVKGMVLADFFTTPTYTINSVGYNQGVQNEVVLNLAPSGFLDGNMTLQLNYTGTQLTDLNNNPLVRTGVFVKDGVKPVILRARARVDLSLLNVTFSEPVLPNPLLPLSFSYFNGNGQGANSISRLVDDNGLDRFVILQMNTDFILGDFLVGGDTIAAAATITDVAGNSASADAVRLNNTDTVPPAVALLETRDVSPATGDGRIDSIRVRFNENVDDGTLANGAGFGVAGYTVTGANTGTTANDEEVVILVTQHVNPDGDATPVVSYTSDSATFADRNGNRLASFSLAAADKVAPIIIAATGVFGANTLQIDFSEPVASPVLRAALVYGENRIGGATDIATVSESDGSDARITVALQGTLNTPDFKFDTIAIVAGQISDRASPANAAVARPPTVILSSITARPTVSSVTTFGTAEGRLAGVRVTFTAAMYDLSMVANEFSVQFYAVSTVSGGPGAANDPTIQVNVDAAPTSVVDGAVRPLVSFVSSGSGLMDVNANAPMDFTVQAVDGIAPRIVVVYGTGDQRALSVKSSEPLSQVLTLFDFSFTPGFIPPTTGAREIENAVQWDSLWYNLTMATNLEYANFDFSRVALRANVTDTNGVAADITGAVITSADVVAPVVLEIATLDNNGDGHIDRLRITFSKRISDSTVQSQFSVVPAGDYPVVAVSQAGDVPNDNIYYLGLTQSNQYDTGAILTVAYTAASSAVRDRSGNRLASFASFFTTDRAPPAIILAEALPDTPTLYVNFSEVVYGGAGRSGSLDQDDFTYDDVGGTKTFLTSSAFSGGVLRVILTMSDNVVSADFDSDTIACKLTRVYDAFNNSALTFPRSVTSIDLSPPAIVSAVTQDWDGNGHLDHILVTFSKRILDSSALTSTLRWAVTGYTVTGVVKQQGSTTTNDLSVALVLSELSVADTAQTPHVSYSAVASGGTIQDIRNAITMLTIVNFASVDGAGPGLLRATSFGGLDVVFVFFSEPVSSSYPGSTPLDALSFNYDDHAAPGADRTTITSASPIEGQTNQYKLQLSRALADTDIGGGGDDVSAADGTIYDTLGNLALSAHRVIVEADPQLAPGGSAALSTTVIAAAAGGAGFLILLIIIISCLCCRRQRRLAATDGGQRIELKDLSPDEIMAKFDVNKDGVLDQKELNNLMEKIVVTDKSKSSLEQQTKSSSDLHISIK